VSHESASTRQACWDARAAANFICGGAGAGVIVFTVLAHAGARTTSALLVCGAALVAAGLACVWLEIGRPLRALHVFFHPRTSWMSREAFVATLLLPAALAAAAGVPGMIAAAVALALAFVVCQGKMLQAARAIPAWRAPLVAPIIVTTGLVEGGGLVVAATALLGSGASIALTLFATLVLVRALAIVAYLRTLATMHANQARAALEPSERLLLVAGTALPLALVALAAVDAFSPAPARAALVAAGLAAAAGGFHFKYTLILRAGFLQAVALAHLPVRGTRR
jgi:phenylacetyl-CoA:acceptor oxidoreductase subunit 2